MAEAILVKGGYSESNTKTLLFENTIVAISDWNDNTEYSEYPYKASIACEGVTENHSPEVVFSMNDATSGNFAPICDSAQNVVYIWAIKKPESEITIPIIRATLVV